MADDPKPADEPVITIDTPLEEIPISEEVRAKNWRLTELTMQRLDLGDGPDPSLAPTSEALMNGNVVTLEEDDVFLEAELPEGVDGEKVERTLHDSHVRFDFSVSVTRVEIDVEKKVVVGEDGSRTVYSASTSELGPRQYAVTWTALATLAVVVGQFALPFNVWPRC